MTLNKKPISWHEEGLKNAKICLENETKALEKQKKIVEELQKSIDIKEKMIAFAKLKGMYSFDEYSKIFKKVIL